MNKHAHRCHFVAAEEQIDLVLEDGFVARSLYAADAFAIVEVLTHPVSRFLDSEIACASGVVSLMFNDYGDEDFEAVIDSSAARLLADFAIAALRGNGERARAKSWIKSTTSRRGRNDRLRVPRNASTGNRHSCRIHRDG